MTLSALQKKRLSYKPKIPTILQNLQYITIEKAEGKKDLLAEIQALFPKTFHNEIVHFKLSEQAEEVKPMKIGCVFSGGQAPGGHNVLTGLFDALQIFHNESELIGFLDGPSGIVQNRFIKLTRSKLKPYRNMGGFDLLGSGRTKIETPEQFEACLSTAKTHRLDGLIIIGGDDSNTNAAFLAEYFAAKGCNTSVVGIPKTIDGDLQNQYIEISFGFDTACKIYSEMIGNIARDALSAKKYYHFIKLMGRAASHVALECALKTQVNLSLIGEEVLAHNRSLFDIVGQIADLVCLRAENKKNYGVILIPEGLIEFIPEVKTLIKELNVLLTQTQITFPEELLVYIQGKLQGPSKSTFEMLPKEIQLQLVLDRDPHGNVQVSQIETEKLLAKLVDQELKKRPSYKGKFSPITHFFGYEGRSGLPSNFDANYCYSLGRLASTLVRFGLNGSIASISRLFEGVDQWHIQAVPLVDMLHMEMRKGEKKAVILKALVDLKGKAFLALTQRQKEWAINDDYLLPGPIQFAPSSLSEELPCSKTL